MSGKREKSGNFDVDDKWQPWSGVLKQHCYTGTNHSDLYTVELQWLEH